MVQSRDSVCNSNPFTSQAQLDSEKKAGPRYAPVKLSPTFAPTTSVKWYVPWDHPPSSVVDWLNLAGLSDGSGVDHWLWSR